MNGMVVQEKPYVSQDECQQKKVTDNQTQVTASFSGCHIGWGKNKVSI